MTGFEKQLKTSLQDFQPDLSGKEKSWENIQKALKAKRRTKYFYGIAAATLIAVGTITAWPSNTITPISEPVADSTHVSSPEKVVDEPAEIIVDHNTSPSEVVEHNENAPTEELIAVDNNITPEPEDESAVVVTEENMTEEKASLPNFDAELSVNNASVCFGEKLQFKLTTKEPVMVNWTFSNGKTSDEPNPSFVATKPGTYAAFVKLTSLISGKEKTVYLENGFKVFPKNEYDITVQEVSTDNFERKYHLDVEGKNIVKINWIGFEKSSSKLKVELNERGNYQYTAEVFDDNGCKSVVNTNFDVATDNNLLAPTAFTPNGDEVNDEFLPKALTKLDDGKFLFKVLDPSTGKILFETNTSTRSWDGINPETGQKMSAGTYVWTAIIYGSKGNKTFKGKISIIN